MAVRQMLNLHFVRREFILLLLFRNAIGGHANGWAAILYGQNQKSVMQDWHAIYRNIENTEISLFAVFDGHAGEFCAQQAKDRLLGSLCKKIVAASKIVHGKSSPLDSPKPQAKGNSKPQTYDAVHYVDKNGKIDFGGMLTDEVLAFDYEQVRERELSGTTALVAIVDGKRLIVANVGDCRAVLSDSNGKAIPLSRDHRKSNKDEYDRVLAAGGYFEDESVLVGNLSLPVTRTLGHSLFKTGKVVIADPEIKEVNLEALKPQALIMASKGIWDGISSEEAVKHVKGGLDTEDYGASKVIQRAFQKGYSTDNFTLLIVVFKDERLQLNEKQSCIIQ